MSTINELKRLRELTAEEVVDFVRNFDGYLLTNNERDVSQSDFKGRILPWTTLKAAPYRDAVGYFAFEISGGATVHVDLMRKQVNPFEKLRLVRKAMPRTLIQTVCRGHNLFGYRPYPENVIRLTVREFARYVDVWRVYDFLNHIPNLKVVGEEVIRAGRILIPSLCFGTGPEHTDDFYLEKVQEIVDMFGKNIILGIKNHSALGSPERIAALVTAIRTSFPDIPIAYHAHNTDGNDLARMVAAIRAGVKIVEVSDHGFGAWYSQAPALSLIQILEDYGYDPRGLNIDAIIRTSEVIRHERRYYARFESPFRGVDPLVRAHKLTGGAVSMAYEQAEQLGLLPRINEIFDELAQVIRELGNIWPVSPGSQILWSTAVSNVLYGRYEQPSDDLKRLLLGGYGPFPFYDPPEWIYQKVLEFRRADGKRWYDVLRTEGGIRKRQEDIEARKAELERELNRPVTEEELVLYLLFPRDTVNFLKFVDQYGKVWLLPPDVWFHRGRFPDGARISFTDDAGKMHCIDIVSTQVFESSVKTSCLVDYHFKTYTVPVDRRVTGRQ
ncbi:pyruvate carboxylase [Thermodesulforhabdus norvegica]|uniref:Pyruvate carboxylase n=1 Tax=Thermodesulforhabdus norvegica TaxID=39841 RepID=A0A1I4UA97_9BACT|nr:pyruvate carboxylase [Thermodesulforhabdus norvegica]SFM85730.1 pyruvate carboxylase [Thermodesulforhabdus norvegica]